MPAPTADTNAPPPSTTPSTAQVPRNSRRWVTHALLLSAGISAGVMAFGPRLWGGVPQGTVPVEVPAAAGACGAGRAEVRGSGAFSGGTVSGAVADGKLLRGAPGETYVSIDVSVPLLPGAGDRPPLDLALVVDRSGSMAGEKLIAARRAAAGLIDRLSPSDRVALIQYDGDAEVVVPLVALDDRGRRQLAAAIERITERGGTNLHGGMLLGQAQLGDAGKGGRINRVVLLSDGQANQGLTDPAVLGSIAAAAAERGVRLTTVGMGLDYNEDLMELLAEHGRGRYHYVKDAASLDHVFASELASMQATLATATEVRLVPACEGVEILEVFGYPLRREGNAVVVPMADLFGGDDRRLVARVRVPTTGLGRMDVVKVELRATDTRTKQAQRVSFALGTEVTTDGVAVERARDRGVLTHVVQIESASAVREAATAYERGDRDGAQELLRQKEARLHGVASRYSLPKEKVAQAMRDMPAFASEIAQHDPAASGGKAALKQRKASAKLQMKARW